MAAWLFLYEARDMSPIVGFWTTQTIETHEATREILPAIRDQHLNAGVRPAVMRGESLNEPKTHPTDRYHLFARLEGSR